MSFASSCDCGYLETYEFSSIVLTSAFVFSSMEPARRARKSFSKILRNAKNGVCLSLALQPVRKSSHSSGLQLTPNSSKRLSHACGEERSDGRVRTRSL